MTSPLDYVTTKMARGVVFSLSRRALHWSVHNDSGLVLFSVRSLSRFLSFCLAFVICTGLHTTHLPWSLALSRSSVRSLSRCLSSLALVICTQRHWSSSISKFVCNVHDVFTWKGILYIGTVSENAQNDGVTTALSAKRIKSLWKEGWPDHVVSRYTTFFFFFFFTMCGALGHWTWLLHDCILTHVQPQAKKKIWKWWMQHYVTYSYV